MTILKKEAFQLNLHEKVEEDVIWRSRVAPLVAHLPNNVIDICQYGFTEILNNAIDHSQSADAWVSFEEADDDVQIMIGDHGVGIFEKIQNDFDLADQREALVELSKGKLTSDQSKHSGEGIFFASRMFDVFSIRSGHLYYQKKREDGNEWLIETEDLADDQKGTVVIMKLSKSANWTTREVFDEYQDDDYRFSKTHVPINLARYGREQLVSRSQAKRILSRFEKFSEVILDFQGVEEVGQAFADEIFRVFEKQHPGTQIFAINTTPEIDRMVSRARSTQQSG